MDDGSTDHTRELVARYDGSVTYIYQDHGGVASALNCGLRSATFSFITFLDSDDLWAEDRLSLHTLVLNDDPKLDMVFGRMRQFVSPELSEEQRQPLDVPSAAQVAIVKGTSLIKRSAFERVGDFDPTLRVGEFIDWYLRAQDAGCISAMRPEVVLHRRWHEGNLTRNMKSERTDYIRLFQAWRQRRNE